MSESKRAELRYKTTNWKAYNAALKARGSLTMWLDQDIQCYAPAIGKRGRQQTFSVRAIEFRLILKCLFGLALRQMLGLVQSLLRLAGLNWRVPDFSTVSRRQRHLQVQLPYQPGKSALELLVDSTGIQFLGEGEWKRKKHGPEYRRQGHKVHLGIDAQTLEIRAIEVTDNSMGDAPMLPELLAQIPADEPIASVGGDGAYDTKGCHAAIHARGAQAVIPPRRNARPWKWSGYHRRSLVETKMHCFKRMGQRVMSRTFKYQVVESHVRVALLNRFTQIDRPNTVAVAAMA